LAISQLPVLGSWPSRRHTDGRLLGLLFVLAACTPVLVFEWRTCIAALLLASVASFPVFVPMTALALNRGVALRDHEPAPALTPRACATLFSLWTATAWLAATMHPTG
jgi:hypothetical protein